MRYLIELNNFESPSEKLAREKAEAATSQKPVFPRISIKCIVPRVCEAEQCG